MSETRKALELVFGALVPPIAQQLAAIGISATKKDLKHWQADADAITRLAVRGLIPSGAVRSARQKLIRKIAAGVREALGDGDGT